MLGNSMASVGSDLALVDSLLAPMSSGLATVSNFAGGRGQFVQRRWAGSWLSVAFSSVDKVRPLFVFDVGGNKLRIITAVHFNTGKVFIREALTHTEYDRSTWKQREGIQ